MKLDYNVQQKVTLNGIEGSSGFEGIVIWINSEILTSKAIIGAIKVISEYLQK